MTLGILLSLRMFIGTPIPVGIETSNCVVTKLKLDKDRKDLLERKAAKSGAQKGKGKAQA